MMLIELDIVLLDDDTEATILEIFGDGEAFLVEYPVPTSEQYEQRTVAADEIKKKIGHV